jgi:NADH dehydrogenase
VRLLLGRTVRDYDGAELLLDNGERRAARTVIWTAGVHAAPLAAGLGQPAAASGRVAVTAALHLPDDPDILVIGDTALLQQDGVALPMLAPVAIQQGKHAARVIAARLRGRPDPAFRYRDKGTMATIGRGSAVAEVGPISVNGFIGWLMWLGLHIVYIIGFRSRVVVLITWAWNFFFYDRPVRLIVNDNDADRRNGDGTAASRH